MPRTAALPRVTVRNFGPCVKFTASSNLVNCGTDFLGTGALSIALWIKPFSLGGGGFGRLVTNNRTTFLLNADGSLRFASNTTSGTTAYSATGAVQMATWRHVMVTRTSGGTTNFYVNGVLSGTANQSSDTPTASGGSTVIGHSDDVSNHARTFDGFIDDVRIFNRVLTATEVSELYSSGNSPTDYATSFLAWYKFDEGSGTSVVDSSGNGRTATITGATWISDAPSGSLAVYNSFTSSATVPDVGPTFTYIAGLGMVVSGGSLRNGAGANATIGAAVSSNVTARAKFRFNSQSVATDIRVETHLRTSLSGTNDQISFRADKTYSVLSILKTVGGVQTSLGSYSYTFSNDTDYWMEASANGPELELKLSTDGAIFNSVVRVVSDANIGRLGVQLRIQDSGSDGAGANGATVDDFYAWTGRAPARERLQNRNFGTGLYFDGSGDYVTPALNSGFDITTGDFSISTWIKCLNADVSKYQWFICGKRPDGVTNGYALQVPSRLLTANTGKLRMDLYNAATGTNVTGNTNVDDGQWHHVVAVYDRDANGYIYVDGVEDARGAISARAATITNNDSFLIGRCNWNASSDFQGNMQDFRFFNRVLTPAEVRALYATGTNPSDAATSLVASYAFDEGSGSSATDASGNAHTGTITGATYRGDAPSGGLVFLHTGATAATAPDIGTATVIAGTFVTSGGWITHGNSGNAQLKTQVGPDVTIQAKVNFGNSTGTDRRMEIRFRDDGIGNTYSSARYRAPAALDLAYRVAYTATYITGTNPATVDSTDYWIRVSCIGGRISNWSSTDGITWTASKEIGILPALAYNNNTYVQFILIDNGTTPTIKMTDLKIWSGRPPIA